MRHYRGAPFVSPSHQSRFIGIPHLCGPKIYRPQSPMVGRALSARRDGLFADVARATGTSRPTKASSPAPPTGTDIAPAPKRDFPLPKRQNARKTRQSSAEGLPPRLAGVADTLLAGQRCNGNRHFTRCLLEANDKLGVRPAATEAQEHRAAYFAQVAGLVPAGGPAAVSIPI
jgi:hypothetical protein